MQNAQAKRSINHQDTKTQRVLRAFVSWRRGLSFEGSESRIQFRGQEMRCVSPQPRSKSLVDMRCRLSSTTSKLFLGWPRSLPNSGRRRANLRKQTDHDYARMGSVSVIAGLACSHRVAGSGCTARMVAKRRKRSHRAKKNHPHPPPRRRKRRFGLPLPPHRQPRREGKT